MGGVSVWYDEEGDFLELSRGGPLRRFGRRNLQTGLGGRRDSWFRRTERQFEETSQSSIRREI